IDNYCKSKNIINYKNNLFNRNVSFMFNFTRKYLNNIKNSKTMKKTLLPFITACLLGIGTMPSFGQAEIQIIHNAADPAAATVDVYVNGVLTLDDFAFRTATPFLSIPSGIPLDIGVAPGNSSSVNDTLKNFEV